MKGGTKLPTFHALFMMKPVYGCHTTKVGVRTVISVINVYEVNVLGG